jgi:TPP-dependent pyruvate/acetoin dehydrogenase alpha subunit
MATENDSQQAWENPLIPNARMRQIYLAMLRARMLEKALPASGRGRAVASGAKGFAVPIVGLEACLVSTSVDLGPGDVVSDALSGGVVDFLRGAKPSSVLGAGKASRKSGMLANCGLALPLTAFPGIAERLWAAMGAAAGLKAATARAKLTIDAETETPVQPGVAVVYVRPGEVPAALFRKVLEFVAKQELPVWFVVLPGEGTPGSLSALALRCGVPGIAVDAQDAVAIYRVAQESIGRARTGGGAALMECVPFVLAGTKGKARPAVDAIAEMERSMLQRRVVTRVWVEQETRRFAKRLQSKG